MCKYINDVVVAIFVRMERLHVHIYNGASSLWRVNRKKVIYKPSQPGFKLVDGSKDLYMNFLIGINCY